jgi:acetate kinase
LSFFSIEIDDKKNDELIGKKAITSSEDSKVKIFVIPTDE